MITRKKFYVIFLILQLVILNIHGFPREAVEDPVTTTTSDLLDETTTYYSITEVPFGSQNLNRVVAPVSEEMTMGDPDVQENEIPDSSGTYTIDATGTPKIPTPPDDPSQLETLQIVSITAKSILVVWTYKDNVTSDTIVRWYDGNVLVGDATIQRDKSLFEIQGLEACTTYKIYANPSSKNNGLELIAETLLGEISAVANITIQNVPEIGLNIKWDPPEYGKTCVQYYQVKIDSQISDHRDIAFNKTSETSWTFKHLQACTKYHVQITPVDWNNKTGEVYQKVSPYTDPKEFREPIMLSNNSTDSSITIKWDVDRDKNNCTVKRIECECKEAGTDGRGYELLNGKTELDRIDDQQNLFITVSKLSPFTRYNCSAKILNEKGWSNMSSLYRIHTKEQEPSPPTNLRVLDYQKFTFAWNEPDKMPGELSFYQLVLSWKPKFFIPKHCDVSKNNVITVDKDSETYTVNEYVGFSNYLVYVRAVTKTEKSSTSAAIEFESLPKISSPVTKLNVTTSRKPTNNNELETPINWSLPCLSQGKINRFLISYNGSRYFQSDRVWKNDSGLIDREIEFDNTSEDLKDDDKVISITLGELKPEFNYTFEVSTISEGLLDPGEVATFEMQYPAGIPVQPSNDTISKLVIDPNKASRDTQSAWLYLPLFSDENGTIVDYAVMVGRLNNNNHNIRRNDLLKEGYPMERPYSEARDLEFKIAYQATPKHFANTTMQNYKDVINGVPVIKFHVGEQEECLNMAQLKGTYCNGPLLPDTEYHVRLRAYTLGGFADSIEFKIKTAAEVNVILVMGVVLAILFLGIFTTLMLLVKKYSPRLLLQRVLQADITGSPVPSPLNRRKFLSHCTDLAENPGKLSNEFQLLQTLSIDLQMPTNAACLQANRKKNRYSDILPYDFSRVKLDIIDNDPNTDYINASFITGYSGEDEYIACQGPKEDTVYDFWRMMDQYDVSIILMLTELVERGKEKCHQYFPTIRETFNYERMSIKCISELHFRTYTQRILVLQTDDDKKRTITHLHYRDWPDHDVPEDYETIISFCQNIRKQINEAKSLVAVHCSAGIGRTGTLIAIDILLQHIRDNRKLDVFGTVYRLRRHRLNMVQRESQYAFIYNCVRQVLNNPYFLKSYKPPPIDSVYSNNLKKKKERTDSQVDLSSSFDNLTKKILLNSIDSMKPLCHATPQKLLQLKMSGLRCKSTSAIDIKSNSQISRFKSEGYVIYDSDKSTSDDSRESDLFQDSSDCLNEHIEPLIKNFYNTYSEDLNLRDTTL